MCFIKNKGSIRHVHPNATILAFWNVNHSHPQGLSRIKNSSHNKQKPLITSVHHLMILRPDSIHIIKHQQTVHFTVDERERNK